MKFPLAIILVGSALIGCVNQKQPVTYKPTTTSARVVDFSFGGAFGTQARYVADGVRACREISEPRRLRDGATDYPIRRQIQVFPSPERWNAFWRRVDRLDVTHWKPEYSPKDVGEIINDGTQWWLVVSTLRRTSQFKGDNAYPTVGHPKITTTQNAAFEELTAAFETLFRSN